jgi:hypothetical protein
MIQEYSRSEYAEASEALCHPLLVDPPLAIAERICEWGEENDEFKTLMNEHRTFGHLAPRARDRHRQAVTLSGARGEA